METIKRELGVTLPEMAAALGISRNLAYQLARDKKIPVLRLGRRRIIVPTDALYKMLDVGLPRD